jgi:hypothetical protein
MSPGCQGASGETQLLCGAFADMSSDTYWRRQLRVRFCDGFQKRKHLLAHWRSFASCGVYVHKQVFCSERNYAILAHYFRPQVNALFVV